MLMMDKLFFDIKTVTQLKVSVYVCYTLDDYYQNFYIPLLNKLKIESHTYIANIFYLCYISFYTAAPLSLCCTFAPEVFKFATNWIEEFIVKGKNQIAITKFNAWEIVVPLITQSWYTWIGAGLFFWGWEHQRRCHAILVSLFITNHVIFPVLNSISIAQLLLKECSACILYYY